MYEKKIQIYFSNMLRIKKFINNSKKNLLADHYICMKGNELKYRLITRINHTFLNFLNKYKI
jgi:hypothetical protein